MVTLKNKNRMPRWVRIIIPTALIIGWFVAAGIGGPYFGKISDVSSTDLTTFLPKSAESTEVNNELAKFSDNTTIPLLIVFDKHNDSLQANDMTALKNLATDLKKMNGVKDKISPPVQSTDTKAAFLVVSLSRGGDFKTIFANIKTQPM